MARPKPAPTLEEALRRVRVDRYFELFQTVGTGTEVVSPRGRYRHWHTLRRLTPPEGVTPDEWWLSVKLARRSILRPLPFTATDGTAFEYGTPDQALELLHFIDQHASGEVAMPEAVVGDEGARRRYLVNSLIEEAIRSSQLEGASTTRRVAKEMIRSGRAPRDRSERMILNNFRALEFIRDGIGDRLTPEAVLRLHEILTEGTLDNPDAAGRLQRPDEERVGVWDERANEEVHTPPAATELEGRLDLLCRFANGDVSTVGFLHPVVRAILLHFVLAYDHPFEDGNGRTARALFYWSMRRQGYWVTEYLSISRIFREGPARYARAFLYTETDELDVTYFVLFHLAVIKRAIHELHEYLERKVREVREVERSIRMSDRFNHRQLALLGDAMRHPDRQYSFASHARSHKVSMQSARNDLIALSDQDLLVRRRLGRKLVFLPPDDLAQQLGAEHVSGG
ncbi:MAG: Fic family protein [Actinomycetota bacterium]|nr:Fic family protein [Actinomycetota bacterium]